MQTTKVKPQTETEKLFADLDKPSLHALSYALRHPDTWPEGFVWDFSDCGQCAMGLAHELWSAGKPAPDDPGLSNREATRAWVCATAKNFAMPFEDADRIFGSNDWTKHPAFFGLTTRKVEFESITPEMVANEIDKYLARAE